MKRIGRVLLICGGFPNPALCILILMYASPLVIHSKSRMRKRACTDLCGGRSAMVVPTATPGSSPARLSGAPFDVRRNRVTLRRVISKCRSIFLLATPKLASPRNISG
jgi:hypothetical protein